ncbi:MAG: pilus assembly protein [Coriobacteriia bacterium]|nr:pilus assembly protein [Coriobacteriia bacterium]
MKSPRWVVRGSDRGAVALEFAVVVPLLLILLFGMLEFGFVFQAQLAVTHAAREGARMAAVADGSLWDPSVVEQRAYPLTTASGLSISLTEPDPESVSVTVSYPWSWRVVPLGGPLSLGDPPTLSSTATMRKE